MSTNSDYECLGVSLEDGFRNPPPPRGVSFDDGLRSPPPPLDLEDLFSPFESPNKEKNIIPKD